MNIYEVTYTVGEAIESERIEAETPVEATRRFMERHPQGDKIVLCVVRQ